MKSSQFNTEDLVFDDILFEQISYLEKTLSGKEFENCIFRKCDLSKSMLANNTFIDCRFEACNLSVSKFNGSSLQNIEFLDCKILGVDFSQCKDFLFEVHFDNCVLDYAVFMGKKMAKTRFLKSLLKEVNFIQADLSSSRFDQTDLSGAVFNETNLTGVDFRSAFNYSIDPELNTIKKAHFSSDGLAGLLNSYQIIID